MGRGPVVTPGGMETRSSSASVTACFRTCGHFFGTLARTPSFTGEIAAEERLEQSKLVETGLVMRAGRPSRLGRSLRFGWLYGLRLLGRPNCQKLGQPAEVLAQRLEHSGRVESGGRVVDRIEPHAASSQSDDLRLAVKARDPRRVAAQELRREVPQRADHARLDQLHLAHRVVLAVLDLDRQWIAVAWRTAIENVRDKHILAFQPDLLE
jgi:hypothetical protein